MRVLFLLLWLISIVPVDGTAQDPEYQWTYTIGSTPNSQHVYPARITNDLDGNLISAGIFQATVDFDPGPGIENRKGKLFVQKVSPDKKLLWVKTFITDYYGSLTWALETDKKGDVYFFGFHFKPLSETFSTGPTRLILDGKKTDLINSFIMKMDGETGQIIWTKPIGNHKPSGRILPFDIRIAGDGSIYALGYFEDQIRFNPDDATEVSFSKGNTDIYIAKYSPEGDYVWSRTLGGIEFDYAYSFDIDSKDNIWIGGNFYFTVDPGDGPGGLIFQSKGSSDIFLLKLSPENEILEGKTIGSTTFEILNKLMIDQDDNLWFTGFFSRTLDIDPDPSKEYFITPQGTYSAYVAGLDNRGNLLDVKVIHGKDYCQGDDLFVDKNGDLYVLLFTRGSNPFVYNNSLYEISPGLYNQTVLKWNANDNLNWFYTIHSDTLRNNAGWSSIVPGHLSVSPHGGIYTSGSFAHEIDFDPGPGEDVQDGSAFSNLFFHKVNQCLPVIQEKTIAAFDSYTMADGRVFTKSGMLSDTLFSTSGCDSIIHWRIDIAPCTDEFENINVYANPGSDKIVIRSDHIIQIADLALYAADGRLIRKEKNVILQNYQHEMDIGEKSGYLSGGLYFLEVVSEACRKILPVLVNLNR